MVKNALRSLFGVKNFYRHMRFHMPRLGFYRTTRLFAALTYGEIREQLIPHHIAKRRARQEFDERYNVQTAARLPVADMQASDDAREQALRYEPIPEQYVRNSLHALPIDPADFKFIDIGAGKGKVMFIAAEHPFQRVIGVEMDPYLADCNRQNRRTYSNPQQRCNDLDLVQCDARDFKLPDGPCVLFFYFPFHAPMLKQVLSNLDSDLANCLVVWVTLEPAEERVLNECHEIEQIAAGEEFAIYAGSRLKPLLKGFEDSSLAPDVLEFCA